MGILISKELPPVVNQHLTQQSYEAACKAMADNSAAEIKWLQDYLLVLILKYNNLNKENQNENMQNRSKIYT